jgi:hypothetical protein
MAKTWYTKAAADSTFATIASAVSLATTTPLAPTLAGFAGTANTAARGDHQHPQQLAQPTAWNYVSGNWVAIRPRLTGSVSTRIGWLLFVPWWLQTYDRAPLVISGLGCRVGSAGSSDSTVTFAIYRATSAGAVDFTTGPIAQTAALATNTTGDKLHTLGSNLSLANGGYWMGTILAGTTMANIPSVNSNSDSAGYAIGAANAQTVSPDTAKAGQTTFPAAGTSVTLGDDPNDNIPVPFLKVA